MERSGVATHDLPPTMLNDRIGARVRQLREARGWSEPALAAQCGQLGAPLSRQAIHRIEVPVSSRPRRLLSVHELLVLARALEVHPMDLLPPEAWPGDPPDQYPRRKRKDE